MEWVWTHSFHYEAFEDEAKGAVREMKNDFLIAITQLAAERNLPRETVLGAIETALPRFDLGPDFARTEPGR